MSFLRLAAAVILSVLGVVGIAMAQLRWLRVLQREHYQPSSTVRFFTRWAWPRVGAPTRPSTRRPLPWLYLALLAVLVLAIVGQDEVAFAGASVIAVIFPLRLSVRGQTGALDWTRRLVTCGVVATVVGAMIFVGIALLSTWWTGGVVAIVGVPLWVSGGAWLCAPYENFRARRFVSAASRRLASVSPRIVAITGSYGKTSTKHHLAELLGASHGVLPSPRSYNNRAGLSRAINENLTDSTRIFIAEMGTYGPGEIAALCEWCTPEISLVTAIGPVHLERMGSLDVIEAAKFEITQRAKTVVLNIDDERLAQWPQRLRAAGKQVRTAGSISSGADVQVAMVSERWRITIDGVVAAIAPPVVGIHESNLAVAIAAALELGLSVPEMISRLTHLSVVANRMVVATAPSGVMVIDDTFNANPQGAASAMATLAALPIDGRRVIVTPGIIEMGREQFAANQQLGDAASQMGAELVVVARTNAAALVTGFGDTAMRVEKREQAVEWVRANLHTGDGVLYLNDLPDQYP
jgi:UDP-N-acetylmuramoyl-tripeptide--D-alanyl-D-alanine ligase